jgi:elongation factor Ts
MLFALCARKSHNYYMQLYTTTDDLARETAVLTAEAKAANKPEAQVARIIEGRLGKFFEQTVLVDQPCMFMPSQDDKAVKVGKMLEQFSKKHFGDAAAVSMSSFVKWKCGDGLQQRDDDFAGEVAAMAGK